MNFTKFFIAMGTLGFLFSANISATPSTTHDNYTFTVNTDPPQDVFTKTFEYDQTARAIQIIKEELDNPVSSDNGALIWAVSDGSFNYTVKVSLGKVEVKFNKEGNKARDKTMHKFQKILKRLQKELK